jgi:hypothetical protein
MSQTLDRLGAPRPRQSKARGELTRLLLTELSLRSQPQTLLAHPLVISRREEMTGRIAADFNVSTMKHLLCAQQADLLVVEGMLALEQGFPELAWRAFDDTYAVCPPKGDRMPSFAGWRLADSYRRYR